MSSSSLVSGISGLKAAQTALNVIGDNLANLNTSGFKGSRISFANELTTTLRPAQAPAGGIGGINPLQVGSGVRVSSIDRDFAQGNLSPTGRPLDLAIQGDGFFIITDGFKDSFTRSGTFNVDKSNDLVDSGTGLKVKGVSGGAINIPVNSTLPGKATATTVIKGNLNAEFTASPVNHVVTSTAYTTAGPVAAVAGDGLNTLLQNTTPYVAGDTISVVGTEHNGTSVTQTFTYGGGAGQDGTTLGDLRDFVTTNFGTAAATINGSGQLVLTADPPGASDLTLTFSDGTSNTGATTFPSFSVSTTGSGSKFSTTIPIFDTRGSSYLVALHFEKTASNVWDVTPTMKATDGSVTDSLTAITFNTNGSFSSTTGTSAINITYLDGSTQAVTLDFGVPNAFSGLTQFGGTSSAAATDQDGFGEGFFSSTTVNSDGNVVALFTNGKTTNIGQLQLATFSNPAGLSAEGNNTYLPTLSSGQAVLKTALSGRVGAIVSGVLESSNVDIAEEFTKLIIAQRAFQANARTITTTDEVLQELVNIVR